jgi:flagellar basal-body rod protein FlgB
MDPGDTSLFSLITKRMSWLSQRQKVLAQNIANADTPGYAPRDLNSLQPMTGRRKAEAALRPHATAATGIASSGLQQ